MRCMFYRDKKKVFLGLLLLVLFTIVYYQIRPKQQTPVLHTVPEIETPYPYSYKDFESGAVPLKVYTNTRHNYNLLYPEKLFIADGSSVLSEDSIHEEEQNAIEIQRIFPSGQRIYFAVEAWLPEMTFNLINKRVDSLDIKTFAKETRVAVSDRQTPMETMPSSIEEIVIDNKRAYKYTWFGQSTVFVEHKGVKFVIKLENDLISQKILNSITFSE